jgi:TRAP-type mannitol/chloroaromatic compound transport system permease small subunit
MRPLIGLARTIDALNERLGRALAWLVALVTLISAGNAALRYLLGFSSNAWLEIQWYLYSAIFLLAAGYTLKHNGHVRVDVLYGRLDPRRQAWIDLLGSLGVLLPFCLLMVRLSWPGLVESWQSHEVSPDAGGLVRWPVRALLPAGFALLALQALSEAIKRIAFLKGIDLLSHERPEEEV